MNEVEESIFDLVLENGLSSHSLNTIRNKMDLVSKSFIVDILTENVNIYTSLNLLIEFLPEIWDENSNPSKNLLNYICGITHRMFYFAREYPLGKKIPEHLTSELDEIHNGLLLFKEQCTRDHKIDDKDFSIETINSFEDLINVLETYPRYPTKLHEMFQIISSLFYQLALNKNQKLRNIDELGLFLSRCLILWRLQSLTDKELITCLEEAEKKYTEPINPEELVNILALELQSYQFLQLGIDRFLVEIIVKTIEKMR